MKESNLMLVQYATAVVAIVLVAIHLLMQGVLVPFPIAIGFGHVFLLYRSWINGTLLEVLLIVVVIHGFNGLRTILLEWRQSMVWTRGVNWATLLTVAFVLAYGTRTVVLAVTGVQT